MSQKLRNRLSWVIALAATLGGLLFAVPVLIVAGPIIEPHIYPVVDEFHVSNAERDGAAVLFYVSGTKSRNCTYLGASALAGPRAGLMEQAKLSFPESQGNPNRPLGEQSFGLWRVEPVDTGELVMIQITHKCHALWDTTTQVGPWRVAGTPKARKP